MKQAPAWLKRGFNQAGACFIIRLDDQKEIFEILILVELYRIFQSSVRLCGVFRNDFETPLW
jgi:hypothetical protein